MANKYLALQKDVFDISKVTVVGSPTITSDGVASGFSATSSGSHIQLTQNYNFTTYYEEVIAFCPTDISTDQMVRGVFGSEKRGWYCKINSNGKFRIAIGDETGSAWQTDTASGNGNAVLNKINYIKLVWDGTEYKIYHKTEDSNWTLIYSYISSTKFYNENISLGNSCSWSWQQPFTGSINLTQFKIYVDNQLVFQPVKPTYLLERRKEGFDLSKFTVVGTPTITEYGVASGFSGSNYLKTGVTIGQNPFKIICKCSTPNSGTGVLVDNISGNGWYPLLLQANNTITVYAKDANGNSVYTGGSITIPYNQQFLVSFEFTGNKYILGLSIDNGTTWTYKESEHANYIANIDKELIIGRYGAFAQNGWLGSIDLAQFSITVDGKEVFTGAKEKFYLLRR